MTVNIDDNNKGNKTNTLLRYLCLLILSGLIGLISLCTGTDFIGLIVVGVGVLFFTLWFLKYRDPFLACIFVVGFFLRISLALTQQYAFKLPDTEADSQVFEQLGWSISKAWTEGVNPPAAPGAYIYSKLIGMVYYIFGRVPLIIQYINVILGVLLVYFIYKIILQLKGTKKSAYIGALVAAIFPTLNLYSAIILRENLVSFFAVVSFFNFFKWLEKGKIRNMFFCMIFLLCASSLHGAMILAGGVFAIFFCFYQPLRKKWRIISIQAIFAGFLFAAVIILFGTKLMNKLPSNVSLWFSSDYLSQRMGLLAVGRGAYLSNLLPHSLFDLIWQTPIRIFYFLFAPLPWMVKGIKDIVGFVDASIYFILLIFTVRGLKKIRSHNKEAFVMIILVLVIELAAFAWGTSNYGTAIRHRQKVASLFIATASIGCVYKKKEVKSIGGSY